MAQAGSNYEKTGRKSHWTVPLNRIWKGHMFYTAGRLAVPFLKEPTVLYFLMHYSEKKRKQFVNFLSRFGNAMKNVN